MSFKLEGSDCNLLDKLRYKRVSELLGEHIPEGEMKLLSNGRITCLICSHRPIFDNMKVLAIHRKGKKHAEELSMYLQQKIKNDQRSDKMIQKQFIKSESSKSLGAGVNSPRNSSKPYHLSRKLSLSCTKEESSTSSLQAPSVNSQVRRYLKSISKEPSAVKLVEEKQEKYPEESTRNTSQSVKITDKKCTVSAPADPQKQAQLFQLHLSGWKRDNIGNLIKDPTAEFDSDED